MTGLVIIYTTYFYIGPNESNADGKHVIIKEQWRLKFIEDICLLDAYKHLRVIIILFVLIEVISRTCLYTFIPNYLFPFLHCIRLCATLI